MSGEIEVGTRVDRPVNVFASSSPVRVGTVTRRYSEPGYDELYEVVWDTEGGKPIKPLTCVGYLRHGLSVSWKQPVSELLTTIQAKGTAELQALAAPETGDCRHDIRFTLPEECLRCLARRELRRRSSAAKA